MMNIFQRIIRRFDQTNARLSVKTGAKIIVREFELWLKSEKKGKTLSGKSAC